VTSRTPFSRTASRRAPRAIATGLLGLAATFSLTACQWTSPITTQLQYAPADGTMTEVGTIKVLNALIVAEKADGPGTVVASFANQGSQKQTVQVKVADQTVGTVEVAPGQVVQASTADKRLQVAKVPAPPGALQDVVFGTADGSVAPLAVPVLPPNPPYATLKPTAATAAPTTSPATTAPAAGAPAPAGAATPAPTS